MFPARKGKNMRALMSSNEPTLSTKGGRGRGDVRRMTRRRERALTRTLLATCAGFLVCFAPSALIAVIDPMPPCWENPGGDVKSYTLIPMAYRILLVNYILMPNSIFIASATN